MMLPELEQLARVRLDNDLTHGAIAEMIGGVSRQTVFNLLTGKCQPIDRTLHKIRRFQASSEWKRLMRRSGAGVEVSR